MQSVFLSSTERGMGMKNYLQYVFINGLAYAFLSETLVILLAMQFGASNLEIGLISSAIYITGFISIFIPALLGGKKVMQVFFWAWLLRSIVCIGYGGVLFLHGHWAVLLILTIFMAYCILRNSAYFLNQVVMSALSKRSELGKTSARSLVAVNASSSITRLASFGLLSIPLIPITISLLLLQGVGIILNSLSSSMLLRIPVRDIIEKKSPKSLFLNFFNALQDREIRLTLLLNLGGVMLLVLFNFTNPFLKSIGANPGLILAFAVGTAFSVILSGRFGQIFVDRFGSKPFLIVTHITIVILGFVWAFLPTSTPLAIWFLLGFITMFFLGLITMLTTRLVLASISHTDRVGFNAVLALFTGLAALIAGVCGGILADIPPLFSSDSYGLTFLCLSFVAFINIIFSIKLKDKGSSSFSETASIFFSVKNLRTFLSIDRLERSQSPKEKEDYYLDIEYSPTTIAATEIARRLHIPLMREKEMLIRSLFTNPRPELLDLLIDEALDSHSWWRQSAIFALGAYPGNKTLQTLYKILKDDSVYLKSVAIKSLARLGDHLAGEEAKKILLTPHPEARTTLNAIIALSLSDTTGSWLEDVFKLAPPSNGFRFQQHVLVIASKRIGTEPGVEYYFYEENLKPQSGLLAVIEEAKEIYSFYQDQSFLIEAIKKNNFKVLRSWCRSQLSEDPQEGPGHYLFLAIMKSQDEEATASDTLAMIYFTYQLERSIPLNRIDNRLLAE